MSRAAALVGVENCSLSFDTQFSYIIPDSLGDFVVPGVRVMVPFGRGNTLRQAFVFSLSEISDGEASSLKEIASVLDSAPILTAELLSLSVWMREHTFCTWFDAAKTVLPGGMCMKTEKLYALACRDLPCEFTPAEQAAVTLLASAKGYIRESVIRKKCGIADELLLKKLTARGILSEKTEAFAQTGDLSAYEIVLTQEAQSEDFSVALTEKQASVVEYLSVNGPCSAGEITYYTGAGESVIKTLIRKGVCGKREYRVFRTPEAAKTDTAYRKPVLSPMQSKAFSDLYNAYLTGEGKTALLYGITGSGKTSVYLELIDKVLSDGRTVIVLIPEISLTPQTFSLFSSRYGKKVAILHSGLSMGERYDEWCRLRSGEAVIAVGTRSAVFAPLENTGLIIIDEEQESTYKSENAPRYNAKDVARFRGAYNKALTVFASATPSVETYARAKSGHYLLTELTERYGKAVLPAVRTVDVSAKGKKDAFFSVSDELAEEIQSNLDAGEQSILLVNRRGFNTFVSCPDCKNVMTCPNCSISLTYHSANDRLMCHYCGYSVPYAEKCPVCGGDNMRYSGSGTQKVEAELHARFPSARVLRMDADTTTAKNAHETALNSFAEGQYDILIGTQMVAKGLDFPEVTLVGVLSADKELYNDDFRSAERTFDLITQVVGRAGRGSRHGRAVIQTVTPDNVTIEMASRQDYVSFYSTEIILRRALVYPPFCDLCTVVLSSEKEDVVNSAAREFFDMLAQRNKSEYPSLKLIVLGPLPPKVSKINNVFRRRIIIKCKNTAEFRSFMNSLLRDFANNKKYRDVGIYADMNPVV